VGEHDPLRLGERRQAVRAGAHRRVDFDPRGAGGKQGEQVLLHQDLHPDNVLAAEREPWLVIDPKPLVGEHEFALASIIRASELGHSKQAVVGRLDRLTGELGLDRERARGWAIGQTIAWAIDSDYHALHAETARWLLEAAA
jgi:streptomycin 6-kinase